LPAYLEREARRLGQRVDARGAGQAVDVGSPVSGRREELGGGLAAVVTEGPGRPGLCVRLEYIAN
jgi:hypothetical protein